MVACRRPLACGVLVLALAACGRIDDNRTVPGAPASPAGSAADVPAAAPAKAMLKRVARSIWGVVPEPPRRKQDLRPELIRGAAVAVATGIGPIAHGSVSTVM